MENVNMEDSFLYFGYACALNPGLVEFRVNSAVELIGKGELKNYSLRFNRKNPNGSARANLRYNAGDYTLGLLYKINKNKFNQLADTEPEYKLTSFEILTEKGAVNAYAFICNNCQDGILPDRKYLDSIAENAKLQHFPVNYINKILSALPK